MTDLNDVFQNLVLNRELDGAFVAESVNHQDIDELFLKKDRLILVNSVEDQTEDIQKLPQSVLDFTATPERCFRASALYGPI